jgi:hypothetical protein
LIKHDWIEASEARDQVKMRVGGNDVSQSMILHNGGVDAIACSRIGRMLAFKKPLAALGSQGSSQALGAGTMTGSSWASAGGKIHTP